VIDLIAENYKWLGNDSSQPQESRVKTHLSSFLVEGNIEEEKEDHEKVIQEAFFYKGIYINIAKISITHSLYNKTVP
jgi:hypothetical protein